MDKQELTDWIKNRSAQLGFDFIGISNVRRLDEEAEALEKWLNENHHGTMRWMENHFEKRVDPAKLVSGAKSVISLMINYYPESVPQHKDTPKIAKYAYGKDYHKVLKVKCKALLTDICDRVGEVSGRCFVDSAPVMERDWAKYSGMGWIGKNTLLIHPKHGSYYFLAELILDLELIPDQPIKDYCGRCTRCIDACPTEAIAENGYWLDARKCISYLTIELRDEFIPESFRSKMQNWAFGCDICQEVCPWNKFSQPHQTPEFHPLPAFVHMTQKDWQEITEEVFEHLFKHTPVQRTKYSGLMRNLRFLGFENNPEI